MKGVLLPNSDHVARYWKPSFVQDGLPTQTAFLLRDGEEYLSINWLEHLNAQDVSVAVARVRAGFLSRNYKA